MLVDRAEKNMRSESGARKPEAPALSPSWERNQSASLGQHPEEQRGRRQQLSFAEAFWPLQRAGALDGGDCGIAGRQLVSS